MTKIPTDEQKDDAAFLVSNKWACLFSEPGTGKTLTAITARKALPADLRTLVIAPKIALTQWVKELAEQGIEAIALRKGADFTRIEAHTVVVTTWALMTTNRSKLEAWYAEVIIADESHACIQWDSKRTTQFLGYRGDGMGLATTAEWCWLMTGTPVVRYADDLWPTLISLFPEVLSELVGNKRRQSFCNRYVQYRPQKIPGGKTVQVPCAGKNEDELHRAIYHGARPIAVRRLLADVDKNLPQERYRDIEIDLTDFDEGLLKGLSDADLKKDTEEVKSIRRAFGRAKVASAAEYLTSLQEQVLVLTWHRDVTDYLAEDLPDAVKVDGSSSQRERDAAVEAFTGQDAVYLVGQIGAVGTALDGLQHACKRVVFVERIGSPALMDQAIARVVRRGQRESVQVETLRVAGHRLEAVTDAVLAAKRETQEGVVG